MLLQLIRVSTLVEASFLYRVSQECSVFFFFLLWSPQSDSFVLFLTWMSSTAAV